MSIAHVHSVVHPIDKYLLSPCDVMRPMLGAGVIVLSCLHRACGLVRDVDKCISQVSAPVVLH